jgi:8-oxo-dGTP diphosphatase
VTTRRIDRSPEDAHEHARPKVAVDIVLFAREENRLKTFLVPIATGPVREKWAFPGGLVRVNELLDDAARRELLTFTGLRDAYLEQLFTFGDPSRDPNSHVVSVAYMALTPDPKRISAADMTRGRWFEHSRLPPLAYDHGLMADYAIRRLRAKLEYTNIAFTLLPDEFTFAELEQLYSLILEREIDRRNFRRRIMAAKILRQSPNQRRGPHRPARLYGFAQHSLQTIEML